MKKFFLLSLLFPFFASALEVRPWFGDLYEFHFLSTYAYSRFNKVQSSKPPLKNPFHSNVLYFGLDVSVSPQWSFDADVQVAATTKQSFNFRTAALQARYLLLDDILGDPISLSAGTSSRMTMTYSLKDVSCPSHGNMDFEANFSLGKELEATDYLRFRTWGFAAIGHANRGAPWVRAIVAIEANYDDRHKWALYAEGINGYGRHTHIDVDHFFGFAKVRQKSVDLGIRYGYGLDVWGTLRVEYSRRLSAKSCPSNVNNFLVSYLLPFSF